MTNTNIGTTASGKAIAISYTAQLHAVGSMASWTAADHWDAADAHDAASLTAEPDRAKAHQTSAARHRAAADKICAAVARLGVCK